VKARRRYQSRPMVGAGAVVLRRGEVLLVKRRFPPNKGKWALPGGLVELGEVVQDAAVREVEEETGLKVNILGLLDVQTDLHRDTTGRLEYHFILVDYLATPLDGVVRLNGESSDYGWFSESKAMRLKLSAGTRAILKIGFRQHLR
jgi:8-oxo-dGTP diphosphatase